MSKWQRLVTPMLLVTTLLGCGDILHVQADAGALALRLPSDSALAHKVLDTESVQGPSPLGHRPTAAGVGAPPSNGAMSTSADDLGKPEFIRTETNAIFTATRIALVEGFAEFIGNQGQQKITIDLYKGGVPFVYRTETFDYKALVAGRHVMQHYARVALASDCGHRLLGHTNHSAWWLPGPGASDALPIADDSRSNDAQQPACAPERREEEELTPGGGGDGSDRFQTDEWYLCTWEVWYVDGREVHRQLLYCSVA